MNKLRRTAAAVAAALLTLGAISLASPAQAGEDTSWDIAGPASVDDTSWDYAAPGKFSFMRVDDTSWD